MDGDIVITEDLAAEPEPRFTPSGQEVVAVTVASTPRTFDKGREQPTAKPRGGHHEEERDTMNRYLIQLPNGFGQVVATGDTLTVDHTGTLKLKVGDSLTCCLAPEGWDAVRPWTERSHAPEPSTLRDSLLPARADEDTPAFTETLDAA